MAETIVCPFVWGRTMVMTGGSGNDNLWLGYGTSTYGGEFRPILKFDFSSLLGVAPSKIVSVGMKMYITRLRNITTMECTSNEVLRPATSGATWATYDGSSPWSGGGCSGSGTDYYPTPLGTRLWASIGYSTLTIDPITFRLMWQNNNALYMRPTSQFGGESLETVEFSNSEYPPYLEVVIRAGSSYMMIF